VGLQWFISSDAADPVAISALLQSHKPTLRRYGAAAAARAYPRNRAPLEHASRIGDPDVRQFAADMLE